jgi:hypothetical protein
MMLLLDQYVAQVITKENNERHWKALEAQHLARIAASQHPSQPSRIARVVAWFQRNQQPEHDVLTNNASVDALHRTVIHR